LDAINFTEDGFADNIADLTAITKSPYALSKNRRRIYFIVKFQYINKWRKIHQVKHQLKIRPINI
jgi:hypothetical protein